MNKVVLLGYLSADPEIKHFDAKANSEETTLAKFNVAVNDIKNRSTSYFINCVAWNQIAKYIAEKLHKGDFVSVDGRLVNRNYINNEGKKVYITEVSVDSIRNYGFKKTADVDIEQASNKNEEEYVVIDKTNNSSNDWESDLE